VILSSWFTLGVVTIYLLLGLEVLFFGLAVIIPSIAVAQVYTYRLVLWQTNNVGTAVNMSWYAAMLVAVLWFIGFVLRYLRGQSLRSLVPMPEFAKILLLGLGTFLLASTDIQTIVVTMYNYVEDFIVYPLREAIGWLGTWLTIPLEIVAYMIVTTYALRAIERMRGDLLMVSSVASVVVGSMSLLTLGIASSLFNKILEETGLPELEELEQLPPEQRTWVIVASLFYLGIALLTIASFRQLREAFVELRPEAIVQLPAIIAILGPYVLNFFPEIYAAIELVVAAMGVIATASTAIVGIGFGSRRVAVGGSALISSLHFAAMYTSPQKLLEFMKKIGLTGSKTTTIIVR